jgi:hypothetical protein
MFKEIHLESLPYLVGERDWHQQPQQRRESKYWPNAHGDMESAVKLERLK